MCGIIGWNSRNKTIETNLLIEAACVNRHRGSDDGVGIIDVETGKIYKSLKSTKELRDKKLSDKYGLSKIENGIVEEFAFSQEAYDANQTKFSAWVDELNKVKSKNIILHHRKASAGDVAMANTHPILVNKSIRYVHNGTAYGFEPLRKWLTLTDGVEFKGDTDTEVLGHVAEFLLREYKFDGTEVAEELAEIFEYGFGVLVRSDTKNKTVEFFKDNERTLFFYTKGDEVFFVSEPIPGIEDFDHLYEMKAGYYKLGEPFTDEQFIDHTENWKRVHANWKEAHKNSRLNKNETECKAGCKTKKAEVMWLPQDGCNVGFMDICYQCWITARPDIVYYPNGKPKEVEA